MYSSEDRKIYHVCMHVSMYACMHVRMPAWNHGCVHACMHACMHGCTHVCMHASASTSILMHTHNICRHIHVSGYIYAYMQTHSMYAFACTSTHAHKLLSPENWYTTRLKLEPRIVGKPTHHMLCRRSNFLAATTWRSRLVVTQT